MYKRQLPYHLEDYPHCLRRLLELENNYKLNACFNDTSIQEEPCALQAFLAKYERTCPPLKSDVNQEVRKRVIRHEFISFYNTLSDSFGKDGKIAYHAIEYLINRLSRFEESWLVASFSMKQRYLDQPELREKKKILVYVSWIKSHFNMVTETQKIQFADLLTGIYLLGHTLSLIHI